MADAMNIVATVVGYAVMVCSTVVVLGVLLVSVVNWAIDRVMLHFSAYKVWVAFAYYWRGNNNRLYRFLEEEAERMKQERTHE